MRRAAAMPGPSITTTPPAAPRACFCPMAARRPIVSGQRVTATDPAGKWKTFTMDAFGNLRSVVEPDPVARQRHHELHLRRPEPSHPGLDAPRQHHPDPLVQLQQRHHRHRITPERHQPRERDGDLHLQHNNLLATKTDAKSQQLTYRYDTYNRLTSVTGPTRRAARSCCAPTITTPIRWIPRIFAERAGRLTAVQYPSRAQRPNQRNVQLHAGRASRRQAAAKNQVCIRRHQQSRTAQDCDGEPGLHVRLQRRGPLTATTYPSTIGILNFTPGASYNYSYDSMYRLSGMTDSNNNTIVSGVSYNAANQLLGMN